MKKIIYESNEKKYFLPPLHNYNFNKKELIIVLLINTALLVFSIISIIDSLNIAKEQHSYKEKGEIDYKIYLKENDYYQTDYLDKGMKYVASLINHIDIDFKYEAISTLKLNYNYTYNFKKTLYITDSTNNNVLYKNEEIVIENTTINETQNDMYILEDLDIDYDYYNSIVTNFKKDYSLNTISYLLVEMNIQNSINNLNIINFNTNNILTIEIPLSEQTIDININENNLNNDIKLTTKNLINNYPNFIIFTIISIISLIIMILLINNYLYKKRKDIYNKTISSYLKKYDSIIVNAKQPDINETKFQDIIRVKSIEELIDVQNTTGKPIIYYQVIENSKSYFIIITKDTLYKLTITRAYLERQKK